MTHRRNQYNAPKGRSHAPKQRGGPMEDRRTKRARTRGDAERDAVREYEDDRRADEDDILDVLDTIDPDPDLSGPEWDDPPWWDDPSPEWDYPEIDLDEFGIF